MGNLANDQARSRAELSDADALSDADTLPDDAAVRVADLLTIPAFTGVQVVAGSAGLDRVVDRVNIMEVPDIVPWVKPHELLLTTGYPLREVPQGLAALVADLDEVGVAALAVKLRRYLDQLPADMLTQADRLGLPVLLLPDDVAFDDLLNAVLSDVLNRQSTILERSELVHRALVGVVLDGGGLDELVNELHGLIGALTFATTPDGRLLTFCGDESSQAVFEQRDLFMDSGRFRSERFAPGVHHVADSAVGVVPVLAGRSDHGRLVVVRAGQSLRRGEMHVLERAATVAALAITKAVAVQAVEAKYRGDFVRDVLLDRAGPPLAIVEHFDSLGWDIARPLVVVVAALDPGQSDVTRKDARAAQDRFANAWVQVGGRFDKAAPVVGFASEVVALVGVPDSEAARAAVDALVRAVSGDGGGGRRPFATGVSRIISDPAGIAAGYEQARRSVHVGRQLQGPTAVAHFDDLGAFRLLSLIEDSAELGNFVTEVLGELASDTDPEAADMRETLRVLLDTNLNVAETSRQLHFHYNTLRYRIGKLERIVGPFTTDPDLRLDLSLALRVMQLRHPQPPTRQQRPTTRRTRVRG